MGTDTEPLDDPLTPEEQAEVDRLSAADIAEIDRAILASVVPHWRKLARVIVDAMSIVEKDYPEIPDIFYAQRAIALTDRGLLESQGNMRRMRFSEVRIPQRRET